MKVKLLKSLKQLGILALMMFSFSCSDDGGDDPAPSNSGSGGNTGAGNSQKALVITTGAQTIEVGQSITFEAQFVNVDGTTATPASVSWTSTETGVATISSAGVLSPQSTGATNVKATVTEGGTTFETSVSVSVVQPNQVFSVLPGAVVWEVGIPHNIFFTAVYLGQGSLTNVTYTSSDNSIVEVVSGNQLNFKAAGEATITASASAGGENFTQEIPVLVLGQKSTPLPVIRVEVDPSVVKMFRNENFSFSATAYNSSDAVVNNANFTWSLSHDSVGAIDQSGTFSSTGIGRVKVRATAQGISGEAEVVILPDTIILVEPFMASAAPGNTQQFTAKTYEIQRADTTLSLVANPSGLTWEIPSFGISIFDVATIDQNGLATIKQNATPGLFASVLAYVPGNMSLGMGAATLTVAIGSGGGPGGGGSTPCGTGSPTSITVSPNPINLTLGGQQTITATPQGDASATVKFSSDNILVANVDEDSGLVTASGAGTATITVCSGSVTENVTVNVTF